MCLEIVEVPVSYVKRFSVYFYPTNSPRPQNGRGWNYTHVVWCVIKAVRVNVSVISGPTPALRQSSTFFILALIIRSNGEGNFCFTLQKYWTFLWDVGKSLAVYVTYHCWLWLHHVFTLARWNWRSWFGSSLWLYDYILQLCAGLFLPRGISGTLQKVQ